MAMDFHYTRTTSKSVPEAVAALEAALVKRQFGVLWHLDIQSTLRGKGLDLEPEFRVLEVCNPKHAKTALETNLEVGYFLPCKMVVYGKEGTTHVGLLRPGLMIDLLGEAELQSLAVTVEEVLRAALDEAVGE